MHLAKRFFFYFSGFAIGIVLLFFFVGGSGASCEYNYGPTARTLKNIRLKERVYSMEVLNTLENHQLDTSDVSTVLKNGDVLFSESNTELDSCKIYVVEGESRNQWLKMTIENCENKATVQSTTINPSSD